MSGETIGELRAAHRRDFWAHLVKQAQRQVRRAELLRGYDPISRKTLPEAEAEFALTLACVPEGVAP